MDYLDYLTTQNGAIALGVIGSLGISYSIHKLASIFVTWYTAPIEKSDLRLKASPKPSKASPLWPTPRVPSPRAKFLEEAKSAKQVYLEWCKANKSPFSISEKLRIKILGMTPELRAKKADHKHTQARLSRDHAIEMREALGRTQESILRSHNTLTLIKNSSDELRDFVSDCSKAGK